jgi:hypothetical protein
MRHLSRVHSGAGLIPGIAALLMLALCCCCASSSPVASPAVSLECLTSDGQQLFDLRINVQSVSEPNESYSGAWSITLHISDESAKEVARWKTELEENEARIRIKNGPRSELVPYYNQSNAPVLPAFFLSGEDATLFRRQLCLVLSLD